jgi:HD-like signal output (HDOD) protein/ActR/RegA family two-component response regulator
VQAFHLIQILFVDDDKSVLDGLRRSMHSMRAEWNMSFATGGAEALALLAVAPADVVVTDMRMPGMTGRDLLAEVKRLYPQAVRFILSGYSESSSIMQVAGTAHQYLSKPCDVATLKAAVTRAFSLRLLLRDERLVRRIGQVDTLPSLPSVYQRILACLRAPEPDIAEVGRIIRADMVMTAMILKLANSAFFGVGKSFKTAERAVSFLGLDTIGGLVLGHSLFKEFAAAELGGLNLEQLWQHSLLTAAGARALALHEGWETARAEEAFLAGVLHDLGKLVLATRPGPAGEISSEGSSNDHAEAGAYLLGLWGFSDPLIEAIAFHHTPSKAAAPGFDLTGILHVADRLAHMTNPTDEIEFEPGYLDSVGMSAHVGGWLSLITKAAA